MTEHEQGQSPVWTIEDDIDATLKPCLRCGGKGSITDYLQGEIYCESCGHYTGDGIDSLEEAVNWWNEQPRLDAMQAKLDALVTANEQMAGQIGDLATERDGLVAKLDAANARIKKLEAQLAELEGQLADVLRVAIARGEELGFADADNEWREWHKQLTGSDYDESEADDNG